MADDTEKAIIYAFDHTGSVAPELRERATRSFKTYRCACLEEPKTKNPTTADKMTRTRFVPSLLLLLLLLLCRSCTRACHAHTPARTYTHEQLSEIIRYHRRRRPSTSFPLIPIVLTSPPPKHHQ